MQDIEMQAIRRYLQVASGSELNEIAVMVGAVNNFAPPVMARQPQPTQSNEEVDALKLRVKVLERTLSECRDDIKHKAFNYNQRKNTIEYLTKVLQR